jgi:hypothetical protein
LVCKVLSTSVFFNSWSCVTGHNPVLYKITVKILRIRFIPLDCGFSIFRQWFSSFTQVKVHWKQTYSRVKRWGCRPKIFPQSSPLVPEVFPNIFKSIICRYMYSLVDQNSAVDKVQSLIYKTWFRSPRIRHVGSTQHICASRSPQARQNLPSLYFYFFVAEH